MATAVETSSVPSTPSRALSLPIASLLGAVYVSAALAILFYLLPVMWAEYVTPRLRENLLNWVLWLPVLALTIGLLGWFGRTLAGDAPQGMHGGLFLMISAAVAIFFIARAFAMNIEGMAGTIVATAVALGLAFLAVRFFTGTAGARWMVAMEEQGWFSTHQYKRSLGVKVRRLTILGVLIIGGSGAYSLYTNGVVPEEMTLAMPFNVREAPATHTVVEYKNGAPVPVRQIDLRRNLVLVMQGAKFAVPALIRALTL